VPRHQPDHFILSIEPFIPPSQNLIESGVRCVTASGMARRNPAAKTNDWAQNRRHFTLPEGIYEGLLVSDAGDILEGFGSNFYGVLNGELRTAGEGMLPGIAQQIVFTIAPAVLKQPRHYPHYRDRRRKNR
jgi:branched-subunit amino acid aminotransferase/4-amino-4-deoxychorismate lyase